VQGTGNGVEEGILFWIWWDGRTVTEGNVGAGGGVVPSGKRCLERGGEEVFDRFLDLCCLLGGRLGVLCICIRWMCV